MIVDKGKKTGTRKLLEAAPSPHLERRTDRDHVVKIDDRRVTDQSN